MGVHKKKKQAVLLIWALFTSAEAWSRARLRCAQPCPHDGSHRSWGLGTRLPPRAHTFLMAPARASAQTPREAGYISPFPLQGDGDPRCWKGPAPAGRCWCLPASPPKGNQTNPTSKSHRFSENYTWHDPVPSTLFNICLRWFIFT